MSANRDTTFGRQHGFADIDRALTFRERVPVQQYEMLRPYIERQRRTGRDCAHDGGAALLRADERNNREAEIHSDHADRARDTPRGAGALLLPPVPGVPAGFRRHGHGHHGRGGGGSPRLGSRCRLGVRSPVRVASSFYSVPVRGAACRVHDRRLRTQVPDRSCTSRSRSRISPTLDHQTRRRSSACSTC